MTPEQQVKEIILLMNPEDPASQTDAVFLVQKYMTKMAGKVSALEKQLAIVEAEKNAEATLRSNIENEKLASETRLKDEKKKIMDDMGLQPSQPGGKPGPGKGRTL